MAQHLTICTIVIRIITIEREYGCGAAGIAGKLAASLGWKLWDQLLTQEVARLAHSNQLEVKQREERRDPPVADISHYLVERDRAVSWRGRYWCSQLL